MKRSRLQILVASVVVALGAPSAAGADAVLNWNVISTNAILAPGPTAHGSTISGAMVQGAVYDAVNAIDRSHQAYLLDVRKVGAQPWASKDAAVATAAYRVLADLLPAQQPALEDLWEAALGPQPYDAITQDGIDAGEAAAAAMLDARENDGRNAPFTFVIGSEPGDWRPSPPTALDPAAWVGNVRPFVIPSPSRFRSDGPYALTSAEYARDFNEVKELGSLMSTRRTVDQTRAAIFWQAQPLAIYGGLMRSLSESRGLDTVATARLFGMAHLAAADGAISCWNDKFYWNFWRPLAAIREADTDGNPATVADPGWRSLFDPATPTVPPLGTPPFPDHPSGHGCVSGSVLNTLRDFFGTDRIAFDVFSSRFPGQPRHFDRFTDALDEVIEARIWGGIHFRNADVTGADIGRRVAHFVGSHAFQPVDCPRRSCR